MTKKRWIALAIGLVIAAAALWRWKSHPPKETKFEAVPVQRGSIEVSVLATGIAEPQNRLELKPPIAGRAESIRVKEGDHVKKGQILAWLSSTERAALLDAARAKGPQELAHWEDLYKPTPLMAPLDGVIIARDVEPGQSVTSQDPILVMSNRLIIKAQVDETDIGQIRTGQPARIVLDAYPGQPVDGTVDHIAYEAITVNNVTIYEVDILPRRVPDFMKSGMTANVTFIVADKTEILTLPVEAVKQGDSGDYVLLPSADHSKKPRRTRVETGVTDGKKIEIVSGLDENEPVLVPSFAWPKASGGGGSSPFSPFGNRRRRR